MVSAKEVLVAVAAGIVCRNVGDAVVDKIVSKRVRGIKASCTSGCSGQYCQ